VWEAAVRVETILPGVHQPDGSWAQAGLDEQWHPAPSTAPLCSSLVPLLPGECHVLGAALGLPGKVLVARDCEGGIEKTLGAAPM